MGMARNFYFAAAVPAMAVASQFLPLYRQAGAPIPARVQDLISLMTLDEMAAQLTHDYITGNGKNSTFADTGLGQVSMVSTLVGKDALTTIRNRNALQQAFISNSRLNIPVSFAHEGLHGGGFFGVVFPMPCLLGPTWNESLMQSIGQIQALEARSYGVDNTFSPVVNLWGADPRFGRYQEGFGPDPTVTSHLGRAFVLGLQGGVQDQSNDYLPNFNTTVWATGKHFVGYGDASGGQNGGEFTHNNRSLFEIYLRPWRSMAAVGLRSVMPSHNTVLDVPMHGNRWLMNDVLRQEFGFGNGSSVSDCDDIYVLYAGFQVARTMAETAARGILATVDLDLDCGVPSYWGNLNESITNGYITQQDVEVTVGHVLTQKFAAGLFDQPFTDEAWAANINTPAHRQVTLEAAQQGIILMQNNGILPLSVTSALNVAMIGPHLTCDSKNASAIGWFTQYGNSYGPLQPGSGPYAACYGRQNLLGSYVLDAGVVDVPLLPDAWKSTFPTSTFTVSEGARIALNNTPADMIAQAVQAAAQAQVAIVVVGDDLASCGEWSDRDSLDLPGSQLDLLNALVANTTTPIVLVLVNGRAASFGPGNALLSRMAAVVEAWRPGMSGAQAIVDVITGRVNPSGKLTNQWSSGVGSIGSGATPWLARRQGKWVANNRSVADPTDGREFNGYVSSLNGPASTNGFPLFRFGHGMSYTTFVYKSLSVSVNAHPKDMEHAGQVSGRGRLGYLYGVQTPVLTASVQVCNTGSRDGTEVVQVYSQDPRGLEVSPMGIAPFWKRLVGFGRLPLAAGACDTLSVPILVDDLAMYDDDMTLRVIPGTYIISAGGRSDQDTLQQNVTLSGGAQQALSPRELLLRSMVPRV